MSGAIELATGECLALDEQGYLEDWQSWCTEVAQLMAAGDGIELLEPHWEILNILRGYYCEFEIAPPMRALVRILRQRTGKAELGSRALYRLFPDGPAKQACRYAGLPRPVSCI